MKIIGEKINGTRKRVAKAISERDAKYIQDLAIRQTKAGANWLDVNAGTHPSKEPNDLIWLIETIQAVVDTPICLDSANPNALRIAVEAVTKTPMINSISGDRKRLEEILPIVSERGCQVIALAMDDNRIPDDEKGRLKVIQEVMIEARKLGVPDSNIYIDPLVMTLSVNVQSGMIAFKTMSLVREEFPQAHLTIGLSNISFGLPARSYINRAFLTIAMSIGLDCAILDPLDRELMAAVIATNLVMGKDKHCLNYTRAYRSGLFQCNH